MAATIDIIGKSGIKHSAVFEEDSVRKFELMKEDYVRLVFSTKEQFAVSLGDYIVLGNDFNAALRGTFYITKPQRPTFNTSTGGYDYDLQFDAPHYRWNNKLFKFEPSTKRNEASWSLTDNLQNHMAVFLRNLEFYGWNYTVDPASYTLATASKNILIQYNQKFLLDALTQIAEAFECEWWITDSIIHFGRAESGTAIDFNVGLNVESMGSEKGEEKFVTRLYGFGAARNLPPDYRQSDEQLLLNGVVQKRVMLPTETPYVDIAEGLSDDEIVEGIVLFDDVYPHMDCEITDLHTDIRQVEDEDSEEEGATVEVPIYRFKDSNLTFKSEYILPGVQLQVQFQSGRLNGMIFDLAFNPDDVSEETEAGQWFEIVRNETYGLYLPNDTLKPQIGDDFVLIGWNVKKLESGLSLVTAAEREVLTRTQAYAHDLQIDPNVYPCKMMADYMYGLNGRGVQDSNFTKVGTFPLGQKVRLNNDNFFEGGSRLSRVVGFEYKLDKPYDGATIYVGESATYSSKKATDDAITEVSDSLTYKGGTYTGSGSGGGGSVYIITTNDDSTPTDGNVYSALRTERQFARKDTNDNISSLWTFNHGHGVKRGIQTKDYNESNANEDNLFGKGFELVEKTDGNGGTKTRMEVDELFVRIKAFFAQLEIREMSYVGGNYAFSSAGSKIYYVEWLDALGNIIPKTAGNVGSVYKFRCYLYSDNGTTATINKWAENDQVLCETFNIDAGVHQNTSNKRYWRRATGTGKATIAEEVANAAEDETPTQYQYVDLSFDDCEAGSAYPEAEDTIVQLGNWTNTARQGLIYLQVEGNGAPAIMEYSGVGANGQHFVLPSPTLLLSPSKNVIYGEFHSVVDGEHGNTGSGDTIEDQLAALIERLNDIQNQADKKFDIWFGNAVPLPNADNPTATPNYPASDWTTEALKALHAQDIYYCTNREPAAQGGRAWRWEAIENNGTVAYRWDEILDADTLASLEKIADVASDGVITGGAEKTRVFIDWMKAVQEYWEYKERAEDYEITTEWTAYNTSFLALANMLNGGVALEKNLDGSWKTPAWLQNLSTETTIPSPITYRETWNNYYAALATLLQTITKVAKELAEAAQATANAAVGRIEAIANDNKIEESELPDVRQEFLVALHEMFDDGGIIDQAQNEEYAYITAEIGTLCNDLEDAIKAIGRFLNGDTAWTYSKTATQETVNGQTVTHYTLNWTNLMANLPAWIAPDYEYTEPITINGSQFVTLWSNWYTLRTAILGTLSEVAHMVADEAHDRINDIVSDGVISAGSEKSLLYIQWLKTIAEYNKYIEQAGDYTDPVGTENRYVVDTSTFTTAFKKLATMLNNQNPETAYASISANILSGATRPAWLNADNINENTVLSETPIATADAYRTIWNNYHVALTALLEVITNRAKALADAAQADASLALSKISDMGNDGKLVPDEKLTVKREFLSAWHERDDEGGILDRCKDNNQNYINSTIEAAYVTPYLNAFKAVGSYLNGRVNNEPVTWTGITITSTTTDAQIENAMPSWLKAANMETTETIDGDDWRNVWAIFYSARTALLTALSKDAKDRADDALDKIGDIVDDGIISGGSEKALLYLQWMKAAYEYVRYVEQAHDYGVSTTDYVTAYTELVKMLNGGTDPTANMLKGITSPLWLNTTASNTNNINHDTPLSDFSLTADQYRDKWNAYNSALVALLEAIDLEAKNRADAAQADATEALNAIDGIAADGTLSVTEIPDLRREFESAYRQRAEMVDLATSDSTHKLIDAILRTYLDNYLSAFKSLANYLNRGTAWTEPSGSTYSVNNGSGVSSSNATYNVVAKVPLAEANFPALLKITEDVAFVDDWSANPLVEDNGARFRNLWASLTTLQVALSNAMATLAKNNADEAQETANDAQDKIADIVSDGIISHGSEKSALYKEWARTKAEYFDFHARASLYGFDGFSSESTTSDKYRYYQDHLAFEQAFDALVLMLNGGTYGGGQSEVNKDYTNRDVKLYNGDELAWLADLASDTTIGDYSYTSNGSQVRYTADKYRTLWNVYAYASVVLLNDFTEYSKALADEALHLLEEIASDGKITPSEKNTLLLSWREVVTEYPIIVSQSNTYTSGLASGLQIRADLQTATSAYITAFNALATILNGGTSYSYTFSPKNFPTPSWLGTYLTRTEELTSQQQSDFNDAWNTYYNTRTTLQDLLMDVAKKPGDDALSELDNLAADNILTPFEKLTVLREWDSVYAEYNSLTTQATNAHITSETVYTNYVRAYFTLGNYLYDLYTTSPTYTDRHVTYSTMANSILVADGNTTINGTYFKEIWSDYYAKRSNLLAAIGNSKVSFFVSASSIPPMPPFNKGDLWMQTDNENNIMTCIQTKLTGSNDYTVSDYWADLSDITEKRDPRLLLAALVNMMYNYNGGYIREKTQNQYMYLYIGNKPSSGHAAGDLCYYEDTVYQYVDSAWESITNETLRMAFNAVYEITGVYNIRVFKYRPTFTAKLYDIVCSQITFTDSQAPSGYQTVEGGIQIQMYNGSDWEVLQESTRSVLQNLPGYVRAVAIASAGSVVNSSGFITSSDWATLFSQATDADGNVLAQAHLSTYVQKDSNGNIVSGVKIGADQIEFTGKVFSIDASHITFSGKTTINSKFIVHADGHLQLDYMEATNVKINGIVASPFVVENSTYSYVWDDDNNGNMYYAAMSHDNLLYNSSSHYLYWTPECSGRLITLCHHESVTGSTTFNAPTVYSSTAPSVDSGEYLWARGVVVYANGVKRYTNPFKISNGSVVSSVTKQYYLSDSASSPSGGSWSSTAAVTAGKHIWVRCICYTYNGTVTSDAMLLSSALNDERSSVNIEFAKNTSSSGAPQDLCFYEDGQKKKSITVSRQCLVLKGYGTATTFFGYIIVKRIDLAPTRSYGMGVKCLAMGVVGSNSSQNGATLSYVTFDGSTLTASRIDTGVYKVDIPDQWNIQGSKLQVMASSSGNIISGTNPLYAGLQEIETNDNGIAISFTVQCGDDSSRNDGSVQFMLFNRADWEMI